MTVRGAVTLAFLRPDPDYRSAVSVGGAEGAEGDTPAWGVLRGLRAYWAAYESRAQAPAFEEGADFRVRIQTEADLAAHEPWRIEAWENPFARPGPASPFLAGEPMLEAEGSPTAPRLLPYLAAVGARIDRLRLLDGTLIVKIELDGRAVQVRVTRDGPLLAGGGLRVHSEVGPELPAAIGGTGATDARGIDEEEAARRDAERLSLWRAGEEDDRNVDETRGMTGREVLTQSAFSVTAASQDGGPSMAFWGRDGPLQIDGEVISATLGADVANGRWLADLMVSHSLGEGSYAGDGGSSAVESALRGVYPYGLGAFGGAFTGTPNVRLGLSDSARNVRLGWRLTSAVRVDSKFEVNLDETRRESAIGDAAPEHGVMLRGALQ